MKLFLSTSIPAPHKNSKFYNTVDVFAIREAIRGLVSTLVEQNGKLVFSGHPAITPLIRKLFNNLGKSPYECVTLYQSAYFDSKFPIESESFEKIKLVSAVDNNRGKSLLKMRKMMIGEKDYHCAVFIGGMEGVIDEYKLFREMHPKLLTFPIASTGAAALQIYEEYQYSDEILGNEFTYPKVFRHIFRETEKHNNKSSSTCSALRLHPSQEIDVVIHNKKSSSIALQFEKLNSLNSVPSLVTIASREVATNSSSLSLEV